MNSRAIKILLLVGFCLPANREPVFAADKSTQLQNLRREIEKYQKELTEKEKNEETALELLASLSREIDLTTDYLRTIRQDISHHEHSISAHNQSISRLSQELEELKAAIKKRMVAFYKHGQRQQYELLLASPSWSRTLTWLKYCKAVTENDRRIYQSLLDAHQKLNREQEMLRAALSEKEKGMRLRRQKEERLRRSRSQRENHLKQIQKNKDFLQKRLEQVREAEKHILSIIEQAEKARLTKAGRPELLPGDAPRFSELKGKMHWPAQGKIISHFGRHKHPTLNTVTENLGIEIRARRGSPVTAVARGVIQTITWQRGRGNIVIISHDRGFYTVYTHLSEIHVEISEPVQSGQVIGTVGDSNSINGSVLHFQIWRNTQNLDPEEWIS